MINLRTMELETAKEKLAEVFHARPADVEELIRARLEDLSVRRAAHWNGTKEVA